MPTSNLQRNPRVLCVIHALQMALFPIAIMPLFWRAEIGMSVTQILLVQAIFGLVMVACEFPSGYLADRIGYRRTLIVASTIIVAGWYLYSRARSIGGIIAAEMLLGVGFSLISGADTALLFESLLATKRVEKFRAWFGKYRFWGQMAEGSSALLAGALFALGTRLPFALQAVVAFAALLFVLRLVEPPRSHRPVSTHWAHVQKVVGEVATKPHLLSVFALTTALSLKSFVPVWLIALYAADAGVKTLWLGPIWATANYIVGVGALAGDRLAHRFGLSRTLLGRVLLGAIGYAGLGLSYAAFGVGFYFCLTLMRGIQSTLLVAEEQKFIASEDRASITSLRSLLFRLSFALVAPLIGVAVDRFGQRPVLLAAGAGLSGMSLLCWYWFAALKSRADRAIYEPAERVVD